MIKKKLRDLSAKERGQLKKLTIQPQNSILWKYLSSPYLYGSYDVYILKISDILAWAVVCQYDDGYFLSIYVNENYRGYGIGGYVLKEIKKDCNKLYGFPKTEQAFRLFKKHNVEILDVHRENKQ